MQERKSLMIVGIGELASLTLNLLTQQDDIGKIYLAGSNLEVSIKLKNLNILTAAHIGKYPEIECVFIDINNIEQTAEILQKIKPDIIFNSASIQSWKIITSLPKEVFLELDQAQFGPWLPMHLTLLHKLMQAVKISGIDGKLVNAAFPDAANCILGKVGLAPYTGIGNVANVVPALRHAFAMQTGESVRDINIALFTQHYFSHRIPTYGDAGGSPFHLTVYLKNEDISLQVENATAIKSVQKDFPKTGGVFRQQLTAASALSILLPMIRNQTASAHAAGPIGLPGGYRVTANYHNISVELPSSLTLDEAIRINNECQRLDGIERIDNNGVCYFTDREMAIMNKLLHYHCTSMKLEESEQWANELKAKYLAFTKKFIN
jgi:hypothetical protein